MSGGDIETENHCRVRATVTRHGGRGGAATQAASSTNRFRLLPSALYLLYMGSEILTGDASNPPLMNSE